MKLIAHKENGKLEQELKALYDALDNVEADNKKLLQGMIQERNLRL